MKLYLAGLASQKHLHKWIISNFPEIGGLSSFVNPKEFLILKESDFKDILLDSGAHSVSTKGKAIDIDEYMTFIKNFNIKQYVCLDVIGDAKSSYDNYRLMKKHSLFPIPVYHVGEPIRFLEKYIDECDYIGLGDITGEKPNWRKFLDSVFAKYPYRKYHMFGVQSIKILDGYPIYSCDGTGWLKGSQLGWVITKYGNFFLNKHRNIDDFVQNYLDEKYRLGTLEDYNSVKDFGQAITKVNIQELYDMLVINHNSNFNSYVNMELF